jgi:hypothetical protein
MAMKQPSVATKRKAVFLLVTHVAEDLLKRCCCSTFCAWAILTRPQPLSENVTVCDSAAVALFVTKSQAIGSKIMVVRFAEHQQ